MANNEQYYGVDLFKFVGAILVIMLHANPVGETTIAGIVIRQTILFLVYCLLGMFFYKTHVWTSCFRFILFSV